MDLVMKKEKKAKEFQIYKPKTQNQENYMECLSDDKNDIVIGVGPAGTGKTLFACLNAISKLKDGSIKKNCNNTSCCNSRRRYWFSTRKY